MALDLKIEIFAYYCFNDTWQKMGVEKADTDVFQVYRDECIKDNSYIEACDEMFRRAITCRCFLFKNIYHEEIDSVYISQMKSLSDCFDYFTLLCERKDLFGNLNLFENFFATSSFALILFKYIYDQGFIDIISYSYISWAMYFDKFTEKFYKEGGWNELKKVAKTYDLLYDFFAIFKAETNLKKYKEASINYRQFKNALKYKCNKMYKGKISMFWIKFQTEHFKKHVKISSNYEDFLDIDDTESLLQELRLVLNFSSENESDDANKDDKFQERFCCTDDFATPYSKALDDSKEIKNHPRIPNLRIADPFCYEIQNRNNFETEHQSKILTLDRNEENRKITDTAENFINCKDPCKMGLSEMKSDPSLCEYSHSVCNDSHDRNKSPRYETNSENSTKNVDLNFAGIPLDKKGLDDNSSSRNIEKQNEAMYAKSILCTKQKKESEWPKQIDSKYSHNSKDVCSKEEFLKNRDEKESLICSLESDFYSEIEEENNKLIELANTLILKEEVETQNEKNGIPKNLSSPKDFLVVSEDADRDGRINQNEQDKLREEQADPEIGRFLRMVLVLGDREGIQHVLGHNKKKKRRKTRVKSKEFEKIKN